MYNEVRMLNHRAFGSTHSQCLQMVPDAFGPEFDEQTWSRLQLGRCNTHLTVSTSSLLECPPSVFPASSDIIPASVLHWDTAVRFSQAQEIGTNVCDPNTHRTPPDVDFEYVRCPAKSASWTSKTPERRSATFGVQGLVFLFLVRFFLGGDFVFFFFSKKMTVYLFMFFVSPFFVLFFFCAGKKNMKT